MKPIRLKFLLCFLVASTILHAQSDTSFQVIILGNAQDAGFPQINCANNCCAKAWKTDSLRRYATSIALVSTVQNKWWLFECSPDIKDQLQLFKNKTKSKFPELPEAVFITHAHIGHYTGLMHFGREAMNAKNLKVYCLPKMKKFLENNGPWSQLVNLKNIVITELSENQNIVITQNFSVTAETVPHRDEYSETAGFKIFAGSKKYLFIPDIDKWNKHRSNIVEEVKKVDRAFLDATFFSGEELPGRNIAEIPHPLVQETMQLFELENETTRNKISFIHFNHSNPILWDNACVKKIIAAGFRICNQGEMIR